jgi:hypothetical protein
MQQIIEVNNVLRQGLERGLPVQNLMENWWVGRGLRMSLSPLSLQMINSISGRWDALLKQKGREALQSIALNPPKMLAY